MRVKLAGVYKYWKAGGGNIRILENVSLEFNSGDFVAIMGPSGSGKSTFLHLLGCIDKPDFGQIFLENTNICAQTEDDREIIRLQHIGFVFQHYLLIQTLSVIENVMLPMVLANSYKGEQRKRAYQLLRLVGLENRADDSVIKLSGGQMQKTAIARALANRPGMLLADEPTGNLDKKSTHDIMEMLATINKAQKLTTIMVTHDPTVAAYADKIYYLDEGRLTASKK